MRERLNATTNASPAVAQLDTMSAIELKQMVKNLVVEVQNAKTVAAHHKLQHQMSQMESGEAVERMAVEMEMARREIEVLEQAEAQRTLEEHKTLAKPKQDPNFQQIHHEVYTSMTEELRDLKIHNSNLERQLVHTRRVLSQQENEIASLNDKVLLMRERIRESREQLQKYRRTGAVDATPRTIRTTPFQTPVRDRFTAINASTDEHQQPGFAALLQASDMVSHANQTPRAHGHKSHSRNTHSLSSLPSTPSRTQLAPQHILYTPQPPRHMPPEPPMTAPLPRKRARDTMTPPPIRRGHESDGTVSASEESEAETEVAEGDVGPSAATQRATEMLHGRVIKKAKSAFNMRAGGSIQTKLFGQVSKSNVPRGERGQEAKEAFQLSRDAGHGLVASKPTRVQESSI